MSESNSSGVSSSSPSYKKKPIERCEVVSIRFAGDSGDGMQLTGDRFANVSAVFGNDVVTLADYPAEIRAPSGTVGGVSGYQLNIGTDAVYTPGDLVDILVAMNPAALKANQNRVRKGGIIIVDSDTFSARNNEKAGFVGNPLEDGSLGAYNLYPLPVTTFTRETLKGSTLSPKSVDRCKNFFALGLTCWLTNRPAEPINDWIAEKFKKAPEMVDANRRAFKAGYDCGDTKEYFSVQFEVQADGSKKPAGTYRYVNGNQTVALGLLAAGRKSGLKLFLGSYPITPATEVLQELSKRRSEDVMTFQAEDEIAGIGTAVGAAYAGALAVTSTSGPGLALKGEFINLAVMTELPLVIVNVQRAGPSTGLPTKTEQSDLLQSLYGRNGDSPLVVMACRSPGDGFDVAYEACRVALKYMTPVVVLSDGYLANGSEPWRIPPEKDLKDIITRKVTGPIDGGFKPYSRDKETLARPWAIPGTPGLEHRIGGLEKEDGSGRISHDLLNHEKMTHYRAEKVERVKAEIPPCEIYGDKNAKLLVLGWGSTYGSIRKAVEQSVKSGLPVAGLHLRYVNPLPGDLGDILRKYDRILLPENNMGQLAMLLRAKYLAPIESYTKIQGAPFAVEELVNKFNSILRT